MGTNNFLPFCATDTGTNLPTQGDYAVDPNRAIGNSPGIASSKLNNKPLRQSTFVASQLAQYISDKTGNDVLDDGVSAKFLAIMNAAFLPIVPTVQRITATGAGTFNATFYFFIASGNATAAATYTNNGVTYTVVDTIAAGTILKVTGNGLPALAGTLTKTGGTGDATLTFYAYRAPKSIELLLQGAGGGGASSSTTTNVGGGTGGATTFSTASAGGGLGGLGASTNAGTGGALTTLGTVIQAITGQGGTSGSPTGGGNFATGGTGGGPGAARGQNGTGLNAGANTGGGGSGGGISVAGVSGGGGGGGAFMRLLLVGGSLIYTASYAVGAGGAGGSGGATNSVGGNGADGYLTIIQNY